jgi:hypothetical protein
MYVTVEIAFENPGTRNCRVDAYTLVWDGGHKSVGTARFIVKASATVRRRVRVTTADGDLNALLARKSLRVDVSRASQT